MKRHHRFLSLILACAMAISCVHLDALAYAVSEGNEMLPAEMEFSETEVQETDIDIAEIQTAEADIQRICYVNPMYAGMYTEEDIMNNYSYTSSSSRSAKYVTKSDCVTTQAEVMRVLRNAMKERKEEVVVYYIPKSAFTEEVLYSICEEATKHTRTPNEGDYLYYHSLATVVNVEPYPNIDGAYELVFINEYTSTAAQEAKVNEAVKKIVKGFKLKNKTEYEVLKMVYNYFQNNISFENKPVENVEDLKDHTAYAALVQKKSSSIGIAAALYRVLLEIGVENRIVSGTYNGDSHAWNIVEIALYEKYFNIDASTGLFLDNGWYKTDAGHERSKEYTGDFLLNHEMSHFDYEEELSKSKLPYTDIIPYEDWMYNIAKWSYENGVMTGTTETAFSPYDTLTRGMFVTLLYRMEGRPKVTLTNRFPDVPSNKYYAKAIEWAVENNIISGYSNGKFGPEDEILNEQIAKILYRYGEYKGYDVKIPKKDSINYGASEYAIPYLRWVNKEGIFGSSMPDSKKQTARIEIAKYLRNFVNRYK